MARDTRALTDEVEHFDEPTAEMKKATQRVTCSYAYKHGLPPEATRELLLMLGVHPSQIPEPEPVR